MKWFLLFLKMYKIDSRGFLEAITYIEQTRSNPEEMGHTAFRSSTLQGLTQIYRTDQEYPEELGHTAFRSSTLQGLTQIFNLRPELKNIFCI